MKSQFCTVWNENSSLTIAILHARYGQNLRSTRRISSKKEGCSHNSLWDRMTRQFGLPQREVWQHQVCTAKTHFDLFLFSPSFYRANLSEVWTNRVQEKSSCGDLLETWWSLMVHFDHSTSIRLMLSTDFAANRTDSPQDDRIDTFAVSLSSSLLPWDIVIDCIKPESFKWL